MDVGHRWAVYQHRRSNTKTNFIRAASRIFNARAESPLAKRVVMGSPGLVSAGERMTVRRREGMVNRGRGRNRGRDAELGFGGCRGCRAAAEGERGCAVEAVEDRVEAVSEDL